MTSYSNGFTTKLDRKKATSTFASMDDDSDCGELVGKALRQAGQAVVRQANVLSDRAVDALQPDNQRRRPLLAVLAEITWWHTRRNLRPQRVLSVPHLLVGIWVLVLLWGERWIYHATVTRCHWDHWERWPSSATPHHVVFVADPQIIDAHSYPGRPWPLNPLTNLVTDNYMRRSYGELQEQLHPDTLFFLGDLFDGGREWRPERGDFADPAWSSRPVSEKGHAKTWRKRYAEQYWQREYARFGDIFLDPWRKRDDDDSKTESGRGRRIIASLPGNHDLGFGDEVQLSVRNRFESFFGQGNRVDIVGNHTFVSVDAVSLSAGTSEHASSPEMQPIFQPTYDFLDNVRWTKQKAVARLLRRQRGLPEQVTLPHSVFDLDPNRTVADAADLVDPVDPEVLHRALGSIAPGETPADLPTILLSHVPLWRPDGTPCGPLREHWPPLPPADDGTPVFPDHRNAIRVARGYQYQNVLSEADSARLVHSIGNVVHAFSGDDHDYCAVVHDDTLDNVPEITVKAFSMAMGVPTPGFLMVSLYNPIDEQGRPLRNEKDSGKGGPAPTMQTHLCLLPSELGTLARYAGMIVVSLVLLAARALLVPVLGWQPFALDPNERPGSLGNGNGNGNGNGSGNGMLLPLYGKAKVEDDEYGRTGFGNGNANTFRPAATYSRGRSQVHYGVGSGLGDERLGYGNAKPHGHKHRRPRPSSSLAHHGGGGGGGGGGPKIQIQIMRDDGSSGDDGGGVDDGDVVSLDDLAHDDPLSYGSYYEAGSDRWQPAARRGVLGLSRTAFVGAKRLIQSLLGGSGSGRRTGGFVVPRRRRSRLGRGGGGSSTSKRQRLPTAWREFWTTTWRVAWMVVVYWAWLNAKG